MSDSLPSVYQQFIAISRYSRWLPAEKRRESWTEVVDRFIGYVFDTYLREKYDFDDQTLRSEVRDSILELRVMPSMRALMTAGPALARDATCAYNCAYLPIDHPHAFDEMLYILMCGTGVGFSVERQYVNKLPRIPERLFDCDTVISVQDSKKGWAAAFRQLIALLYAGQIPKWDTSKVRKAGIPLKVMGGRASGPAPLNTLFQFTVNMFRNAAGGKLTTVECHSLACMCGDIVVVGGVRRCMPKGTRILTQNNASKPIEDVIVGDMVMVSDGSWSAVTASEFSGVKSVIEIVHQDGTIQCTKDHRVAVLDQFNSFKWVEASKLVEGDFLISPYFIPSNVVPQNETELPTYVYERPKHSTTCVDIVIPKLDYDMAYFLGCFMGDGYTSGKEISVACHGDDRAQADVIAGQIARFGVNVTIQDPREGDFCIKVRCKSRQLAEYLFENVKQPNIPMRIPDFILGGSDQVRASFLQGLMDADGSVKTRPIQAVVSVYPDFVKDVKALAFSIGVNLRIKDCSVPKDKPTWQPKTVAVFINAVDKQRWIDAVAHGHHFKNIEYGDKSQNSNSVPYNMVKGLVPSNWGSVNISLDSQVKRFKLNPSFVTHRVKRINEVSGSVETYDLSVSGEECFVAEGILVHNSALISLSNPSDGRMRVAKSGQWWIDKPFLRLANNSACYTEIRPEMQLFFDEWKALYESKSGERGIFSRAAAEHHVERMNKIREDNGFELRDSVIEWGTNPCSEILLRAMEMCNLTEVVCRASDTLETLLEKIRIATILGTIQSCFTHYKYIRNKWKKNAEEERLLGVSLTGIMDCPLLNGTISGLDERLQKMRLFAISTNAEFAKRLGINPSKAVTCVKPSGTVSQLVAASSGIHYRYSPYYVRTVRCDKKDPMYHFMKSAGALVEDDVMKPDSTAVFSFAIESPRGSVVRVDHNAIDHLEMWKSYALHWCEHKPSITVDVREHEWLAVGAWVYENFELLSGISFLPFSDHSYQQAPYQEVDRQTWEAVRDACPTSVDWAKLSEFEKKDHTVGSREYACTGDKCELVDL